MASTDSISGNVGGELRGLSPAEITFFDQSIASVFDASALGLVRYDREFRIQFANRKALELCGRETLTGVSVYRLAAREEDRMTLHQQLAKRQDGKSTEYTINILDERRGCAVPIVITGMPITGANGEVVGGIALVRSLEMERRIETFHEAIHNAKGAKPILEIACEQLWRVIPFDSCSVNVYSRDRQHVRTLISWGPEAHLQVERWLPVRDSFRKLLDDPEARVIPAAKLQELAPGWDQAPTYRQFRDRDGAFLRYPIVLGGEIVGALSCWSKNAGLFDDDALEQVKALPLSKALAFALLYLDIDRQRFRSELLKGLMRCHGPKEVASVVTERIRDYYGWGSVEVYEVDEHQRKCFLLSQHSTSLNAHLPPCYEQVLTEGVLGAVYRTGLAKNIPDVTSEEGKKVYLRVTPETASELCMPIRIGGRILMLLNIEDQHPNAFSADEQAELGRLLEELGTVLTAARTQALLAQSFVASPSAVFVVDTAGQILECNPTAQLMLDRHPRQLAGTRVADYFGKPDEMAALLNRQGPEVENALIGANGKRIPVLVGAQKLPEFRAWVVSAKDISHRKRVEELELLGCMYQELAAQIKTPLALAYSWITRVRNRRVGNDPETAKVLDQALNQLKRVDVSFERLAMFDDHGSLAPYNEILIDLNLLIRRLVAELPEGELGNLELIGVERQAYVRGDAYQMTFMIETTLSYLFRSLPEGRKVTLELSNDGERLTIRISGPFPWKIAACEDGSGLPEAVSRTLYDMSLGENIIQRFLANNRGKYSKQVSEGWADFQFEFPSAAVKA